MAVVGQLMVLITGNHAPLMAAVGQSEAALRGLGATSTSTMAAVRTAMVGIGAVAAVGIGLAVNAAKDFQEQLGIINTVARLTPEALAGVGKELQALAAASGTPLSDLTQAFYDLVSAGIPASQSMGVLAQANTLAIGGLATSAQTVDLLTTAINAYQLNTAGAALATDQFAQAIGIGKVTAAEIASTFSGIAPLARSAGIGIDQIAATYGFLTAQGSSAGEAMTKMERAIIELLKPSTALVNLQDKLGVSFANVARAQGLVVALEQMRIAAAANNVPFQDLFGRIEGLNFALATTGSGFAGYSAALAGMGNVTGEAAEQAAIRMGTFDRQMARLGATVNNLAINLGTALLPPLTSIVETVNGAVTAANEWAAANPLIASSILPIVAGVGLLAAGVFAVNAALALTALLLSPIAIIVGLLILAVANMDKLVAGARVVQEALGPQGETADFMTRFEQTHGRRPNPAEVGQWRAGTGAPLWGDFGTPGFGAGEVGSPYLGPMTPKAPIGIPKFAMGGIVPGSGPQLAIVHGGETITPPGRGGKMTHVIHNHIHLNGRELKNWIESELFNDANQFSSGFTAGAVPG